MKQDDEQEKKKDDYESPKVTRVSLRPEEAVLGHCKISTSGGPASSGGSCIFPTPCPNPGS